MSNGSLAYSNFKERALGLTPKEQKRYSLARAINAIATENWKYAGFERDCHLAMEKTLGKSENSNSFYVPIDDWKIEARDLSSNGGLSSGGALVGTTNRGDSFIELLRNRMVTTRMGATFMSGLRDNVTIPKQTGANTATWLANENSGITESNLTLSQISMTPKNVGSYQEVSRQLLLQSSPSVDSIIAHDLAKVVSLAVDSAAINGTGTAGQPSGLLLASGLGSFSGTSLGLAGLMEAQVDTIGSNQIQDPSTWGYVTTPAIAAMLMNRQRFSGTDTPLWEGNVFEGSVLGFKALASNQAPNGYVIAGDWSQLLIGEWGHLEIATNPYANFQAGIVGIRAIYTVDIAVRLPGAFSVATSVT